MAHSYIDSHFHVWELDRWKYPWPGPELQNLYRNITTDEYWNNIKTTKVKGAVFIQVLNNNPDETRWLLSHVKSNPFLKGVVGGLDLTSTDLCSLLDELCQYPEFVGVRHILDLESEDWILQEDVHKGLALLEQKGLTYDLLLRPHLLKYIPDVVEKFPKLKFIVDHIAKPLIKDGVIDGWREDMALIAQHKNVYCKISGLVTEADAVNWKNSDFIPYVQHIIDIFGEDRIMFGSDWPVCTQVGVQYQQVLDLTDNLTSHLTPQAKHKFFYENAKTVYGLNMHD